MKNDIQNLCSIKWMWKFNIYFVHFFYPPVQSMRCYIYSEKYLKLENLHISFICRFNSWVLFIGHIHYYQTNSLMRPLLFECFSLATFTTIRLTPLWDHFYQRTNGSEIAKNYCIHLPCLKTHESCNHMYYTTILSNFHILQSCTCTHIV